MSAAESLTPQQRLFCEHYIANGRNGTQAAISAGYGVKSAHVRAHKLLAMEKVQEYLAELVIPAAAKALDELGKKGAALQELEAQLTAREEAVAGEETLEAMRDRIKRRMIESLVGMAFTNMGDLASWTEGGVQFVPSAELTPEALEAIETIESEVNEGESQDGKTLYRNARLKVKRHDRRGAMKDLRELLEIGPRKVQPGAAGSAGPAVLVVVAGGPTGLELGAQVRVTVSSGEPIAPGVTPGARPVAIVAAPVASGDVSRGTSSSPAVPAPGAELRPWNPRPKKKRDPATAPAAVRPHVSRPTGRP